MSGDHNSQHSGEKHVTSYAAYFFVWFALLMLTVITVVVAGINFGNYTVATALFVASIKSYLVLTIFMHLKAESKIFKGFVGVALFFLLISLVLLFSDYSFL
ncbi:MAG: cytochrome C oxidase subunit IV family protein [Ignavibacteriaceae bacterium]|nr:cytochrome C oxidase subunit IV family protein [Ignavibacteriaceae bacterium]